MDISSSERLYFDKYLNNLRQVELCLASFFRSCAPEDSKTVYFYFFFLPFQSQNEQPPLFCRGGGAYTPRAALFLGLPLHPAPCTCSSASGRTSADMTHGSVTCSPLCQVPFPKQKKTKKTTTQSALSDSVPTYTHRQTTLHPAGCELLDNQAGRKAEKTVFCFIFIMEHFFFFSNMLCW